MSLSYVAPHRRRAEGRRLGLLSAASWTPQEPDADTLRRRALEDRRGGLVRHGVILKSGVEWHWEIRYSVKGRSDQFDVIFNGLLERTCGKRGIPAEYRP